MIRGLPVIRTGLPARKNMIDVVLTQKQRKHQDMIWEQNKNEQSFIFLLPYPYLLFKWSLWKDTKEIAKIESHRRGAHRYCTKKNCLPLEDFIRTALGKQLCILIRYRIKMSRQQSLGI